MALAPSGVAQLDLVGMNSLRRHGVAQNRLGNYALGLNVDSVVNGVKCSITWSPQHRDGL